MKYCFAYRPPHNNNKHSELSDSLNEITNKYDNLVVIGIDAWHRRFEGAELQLPKNVCFIKICS